MRAAIVVAFLILAALPCTTAAQQRRPLAERDIADITTLVMLEDRRDFNADALARILRSSHPEVRRRAALSTARINDPRGRALLLTARTDADTSVAATAVFGIGQLRDSASVPLLESLMSAPGTPVTVAVEAARGLGKIRTPATHAALAKYLGSVTENARTRPIIGEALLSMGRQLERGDIAAVTRFIKSTDEEVRWRATWALFRPRDPAAIPALFDLTRDQSGLVRSWAMRGLAAARVDSAGMPRATAVARLIEAAKDTDRRARTEAIRTLGTYDDAAAFDVLVRSLDDADTWVAISAADSLKLHKSRSADAIAALTRIATSNRSSAMRIVAVQSLLAFSPQAAAAPAELLAKDTLPLSQQTARTVATRLNPPAATPGTGRGAGGGGGGRGQTRPLDTGKTEADYRRIVETWIVPDYNGAPRPRARWEMAKGIIEIELYPGDAPLAVEDFMKVTESGALVGVVFSRVVPNFVLQQSGIYSDHTLRDEVTRRGLTRGNLSWASAGLDTGRPGYTLGNMPQPHNEGDFTTLGRVVAGMDVVDRVELGDRVVSARIVR